MNALSEQLLEAVDILTTRKIESLQIDKSISCIVEELVDEDKNEYKVKCNGTSINAIAPTGTSYAKGAIVQVKMVDDGINIIEALINQIEGKLAYNPIMEKFSSNLLKDVVKGEYKLSKELIEEEEDKLSNELIKEEERKYKIKYDFTPEQQDYFKSNTSLLLAMTIRTEFVDKITSGNYGAKVTLDAADRLTDYKYNFDIASFTGSVYNFSLESEQSILLNFISGKYNSITIELFSDISQEPNSNYVYISNLGVYFTSAHDSASLYNINIESETNAKEAHLTASLNYDGEVYKPRTLAWSWYEYDLVNGPAVGAEDYDKFMGEYWKKIGEEKETCSITLTGDDWLQKKIKAKVLINGQKEYKSQEVNISNPNFNYTFDIKSSSVATNPTLELVVKNKEDKIPESHSYIANWFFDENPSIKVDKVNSWQIPQDIFRKYKSREITVDIYSYNLESGALESYITTLHYSLSVDLQAGIILLPVTGVDWFQYSGQGILLSDTNQFSLTVDVGENGPVSEIEWYFDNKLAVSYISDKTVLLPSNTMITSIDGVVDNTVTFSIDKKYDYTKTNNTFSFSYKRDGQIYTQSHELKFLLIGQTGTNGTGWYGGIEDTDTAREYQLEVYKNGINMLGSIIPPAVEYINCSGNISISDDKGTIAITAINGPNPYIKVKVTTNDNGLVFYIFHPVSYIQQGEGETATREPALLPSNNLPKTVMYDTNGVNPPFLSKQIDIKEESYSIATNSTSSHPLFSIGNRTINGSTVYYIDLTEDLKGVDSFVQEYQINVVKDGKTTTYKSPIIFYLNRYGNNTINDWDGQSIQIDKEGKHTILAPTIIAGTKPEDNSFSGVVMGKDPLQISTITSKPLTGIYGYKEGEKTFALTEEGDAIFRGTLEAASGDFTGKVIAGEGQIGGWDINQYELFHKGVGTAPETNNYYYSYICANPNAQKRNNYLFFNEGINQFKVTSDGTLFADNAQITGDINATAFTAAQSSSSAEVTLASDGLNFRPAKNDGNPSIQLQPTKDKIRLILGSGTSDDSSTKGRLFLQKRYDKDEKGDDKNFGELRYYTESKYQRTIQCGASGIWIHTGTTKGNITLTPVDEGNLDGGTWKVKGSAIATTSDINKKNSITTLPEEYSILFDNLHPVTYKYNDGTSDRLHTGFIAQEVAEALAAAGIPTKDFAGLVISDPDTEDESWYLRYEEFIALNTQQIQKMKTHISELEERIAHLENLLQANSN